MFLSIQFRTPEILQMPVPIRLPHAEGYFAAKLTTPIRTCWSPSLWVTGPPLSPFNIISKFISCLTKVLLFNLIYRTGPLLFSFPQVRSPSTKTHDARVAIDLPNFIPNPVTLGCDRNLDLMRNLSLNNSAPSSYVSPPGNSGRLIIEGCQIC